MSKQDDDISTQYNEIIKKAEEQPGIVHLSKVYGQYYQLMKRSSDYLNASKPKIVVSFSSFTK